MNAPAVWAAGSTGRGVVVGGQDTGYRWDHPALKSQYRGWNGVSANHDYNWHDSIHTGSSSCGTDSPVPCDDDQHGTHTMGTMVGDDGGGNGIGMAPGARWIGCRNMREGIGTPYTYIECYQWFIAPTRVDRTDPDPAMAPDVINNSWSCPPREGCDDPNMLRTVVNNVRAAGIITVHAAGNSGSACGTVDEPAASYKSSFSVGASNGQDIIASFSSRGPVTVDGSSRRKPDISAPGVGVRSSLPPDGYGAMSGTSMAAPHVAGLCALVLAANPDLAGRVDVVENILKRSALPLTSDQGCGGDGPQDVPNNVYGWGRIDGLAAYQEATTGSITVKIGPSAANASGAAWRVNDGIWREAAIPSRGWLSGPTRADSAEPAAVRTGGGRWLKVRVTDSYSGKTKVNVTLPLGLVNAALRLGGRFAPEPEREMIDEVSRAVRDGLTGIFNRRRFDDHIQRIWQLGIREHRPIAMLMVDIDFFKPFNDHYGHQAGDEVLKSVAGVLARSARRPLDFVARYGGEEFAVGMVGAGGKDAVQTAERVRKSIEHISH